MNIPRAEVRRGLLLLIFSFIVCFYFLLSKHKWRIENIISDKGRREATNQNDRNWFSDCTHVYLDVGTNIGVQIRKVFEPHLYPEAKMHPYFNKHFGGPEYRKSRVCAIGFEPNPRFEKRLKELESKYNRCGYRVKIFTKTAVSAFTQKGGMDFWSDGQEESNELGGTIVKVGQNPSLNKGSVDLIRLSDLVLNQVNKRNKSEDGVVLLKMDIEGSELEVLTDLLLTGALSTINLTFVEWHLQFKDKIPRGRDMNKVKSLIENTKDISQKYRLKDALHILDMDDETYYDSDFSLPQC
ncbi:unnamed protein product [Lepeophtheirus salmonis]|uniref:(salmon louse) hypothetical protein n=2 Tax=Lepeophtheirus salmonis TaxID=72036 RepID=A0A7R8CXF1_LEPSM|nr:unnamed protein product [Lepeophtheirus salmonis]CAF2960403.1 unnamed protein product [Lepeophtheirus salmonis]